MKEFDDRSYGGLIISDSRYLVVLAAGTAKTITVPEYALIALFSADADFYAEYNTTAVVPTIDIMDGTAPELNPTLRSMLEVTTISVIASTNAILQISFYN